ncbi:MAG: GNAT family N-acetyltransferase [Cytophagales bacterium]|nr:MAG: GNAT family N-acetyltransferase [Cytophagales bacterium]
MIIRNATLADLDALVHLSATTMREAFGPPHNPIEWVDAYIAESLTPAILAAELQDPKAQYFVVETDAGQAVGYAKVRRNPPPRRMVERRSLEIQRIYLLESHIGGGLGRKLMDHCRAYAAEKGYRAVYLGVWERNERAKAFYVRLGFKPFGWHAFQFGPDRQRDIWMENEL